MTSTGTWSNDYNTLNNNHYTCFSTGTTCTSVYYIYYTHSSDGAKYITLTNGKKVEDALNEMFINTTDSTAKSTIDTWYNNNLSSYTSYIEDTIYCNDRSISDLGGWDPNGGDTSNALIFGSIGRITNPSLLCNRNLDRFTVSSTKGNGALTYPIGLLTSDELVYSGGKRNSTNNTYYLYTNQYYWTSSPSFYSVETASGFVDNSSGSIYSDYIYNTNGLRPVVSLDSSIASLDSEGDGTATNPYVIVR